MSLQFTNIPQKWSAAHQMVQYEFLFTIALPTNTFAFAAIIENIEGKIALYDINNDLLIGTQYYVGAGASLLYETPATVVKSVLVGSVPYKVIDKDFVPGYTALELYTPEYIQSLSPAFSLYIEDVFTATVRYFRTRTGGYRLNLSSFLRSAFDSEQSPTFGEEPILYRKYRLDYNIAGQVQTGLERYVTDSVVPPLNPACSQTEPDWQFDLTTLQCEQSGARTNSNRQARQKDMNASSPTFGQFRDGGAYFYYDSNATACPILYQSAAQNQVFRKQDCGGNLVGSLVPYTVAAGSYTSLVSQLDADNQAISQVANEGQDNANLIGTCGPPYARLVLENFRVSYPVTGTTYQADSYCLFSDELGGAHPISNITIQILAREFGQGAEVSSSTFSVTLLNTSKGLIGLDVITEQFFVPEFVDPYTDKQFTYELLPSAAYIILT